MIQIKYSIYPDPKEELTLEEWLAEFKVGRMAPKVDNGRAREMMSMWDGPEKSFFDKVLEDVKILSIFRS